MIFNSSIDDELSRAQALCGVPMFYKFIFVFVHQNAISEKTPPIARGESKCSERKFLAARPFSPTLVRCLVIVIAGTGCVRL